MVYVNLCLNFQSYLHAMFFVDKYAPQNIHDIHFHFEEYEMLRQMSTDESIPHIIFYGPEGSGKKTMIKIFLEMLYDEGVHNLTDFAWGNNSGDESIRQSEYHIEIKPHNTNSDRYLIQDNVKEYAKRAPLDLFKPRKPFKVVLIHNIDNMSYYAQTSLRCTMEKYSATCRFIMWTRSLSKVIDPLLSRCYCFRVPLPPETHVLDMLMTITLEEGRKLSMKHFINILRQCRRNPKQAMWLLELILYGDTTDTTYSDAIQRITLNLLIKGSHSYNPNQDILHEIMTTTFSGSTIIKDVYNNLVNSKLPELCKRLITHAASQNERGIVISRREIIHINGFFNHVVRYVNDAKNNHWKLELDDM